LDLGFVCRTAAQSVGGTGGGHTIASGATIPKGKEKVFIEKADKIVGEQMKGKDK
jgi:RecJ-like exonuclease